MALKRAMETGDMADHFCIDIPVDSEGTYSVCESSCHLLVLAWPHKNRGNLI